AVLVDTPITVEQARALANWIAAHGKNLTTIYATHGHGDHFFGASTILERFTGARFVARPEVIEIMRQQASPESLATYWNPRFPGQISSQLAIAEELTGNVIDLEGQELVSIPLGHTDTDNTTCLHIPSVGLERRRIQRRPPLSSRVQSANAPRVDCRPQHGRGPKPDRGDRGTQPGRKRRQPQDHRRDASIHPRFRPPSPDDNYCGESYTMRSLRLYPNRV